MKHLIIVVSVFLTSCGNTKGQGEASESTQAQEKEVLVEPFFDNEGIDFNLVSYIEIASNNVQDKVVTLHNDLEAEGEPGDFRKINIGKSEFINFGGWTKVSEEYSSYSNNGYFLEMDLGNKTPVIVLFGYVYASDPGFLSIISLSSKPELIFNRQVILKKVEENGDSQSLVVTMQDQEHKLYIDNGTLKFEKI